MDNNPVVGTSLLVFLSL